MPSGVFPSLPLDGNPFFYKPNQYFFRRLL
nr:MAG TPA: hypothetical protein [Caudoviricetes sp.]DAL86556.1 MAG TPA: hypothetical protein [Caudoviricetes sp.]